MDSVGDMLTKYYYDFLESGRR